MQSIRVRYFAVVFLLTSAGVCHGQIVSGTITGVVRDPSGAVVAGAQVSCINNDTGLTRTTTTNASGDFGCPTLPPGHYTTTATHQGFKQGSVTGIELLIDQTIGLNIVLQVGQNTEQVTVEASAQLLQTDTSTVGQVIDQHSVESLPLNGRNFLQLATLSAGVVAATNTSNPSARLGRTDIATHIGGARGSMTSYLIDGMESRGARFGEISILPSIDAIQEFKIQRNSYSAEYGDNPGIISISIKSGTNKFHGSVYDFLRNDNLDARQFFDPSNKPEFKLNQFGATTGGPVFRNRTFFFAGYEGRRQRRGNQSFATVPDPLQLTGDFSRVATTIRDPLNNNQPFQNNTIPKNRISQVTQKYLQYIPAPNTTATAQGNYVGGPSTTDDFDQYNIRVDHRFSSSDTMFGHYSSSTANIDAPGLLPFSGTAFPLDGKNVVVEETHIFGPATVNTLKVGYSRGVLASALTGADQNLAAAIGFANVNPQPFDYSLTGISVTGFSRFGYSANTFRQWTNTYAISDSLALNRGRHYISLGGDIRETRTPSITTNGSNGSLTYTNRFTGLALADFLLGTYTSATAQLSSAISDFRFRQYAVFAQDDWKISSNLTLNLGLRYEYAQPWREKGGSEGFFDPSIGLVRLAKDPSAYGATFKSSNYVVGGVQEGVQKPQFLNFAPRVGLAYQLGSKTVLRSGWGVFYAMNLGNDSGNVSQNPGQSVTTSATNAAGRVPRLADTLFDSIQQTVGSDSALLLTTQPLQKTPYLQQWNLNIQRSLPGDMIVEIGYNGSIGRHLTGRRDLNQARLLLAGENLTIQQRRPYPNFQSILAFEQAENSDYNALIVRAERRFNKGISLLANYTWSKSIDTASGSIDDALVHQITNNRNLDRGPSTFDVTHRFVFSGIWNLPFGKSATGSALLRWPISGWQMNTIYQVQTGVPFSPLIAGDQSNTGVTASERPNRIADGTLPPSQRSPQRWFDTTAFVINPVNTYGNAGRNILRQDGSRSLDVSLFKNNRIGEHLNAQFRAEAFNIMNNTNFGRPGATLGGANFGVVTTAGHAREIQFALKLLF